MNNLQVISQTRLAKCFIVSIVPSSYFDKARPLLSLIKYLLHQWLAMIHTMIRFHTKCSRVIVSRLRALIGHLSSILYVEQRVEHRGCLLVYLELEKSSTFETILKQSPGKTSGHPHPQGVYMSENNSSPSI